MRCLDARSPRCGTERQALRVNQQPHMTREQETGKRQQRCRHLIPARRTPDISLHSDDCTLSREYSLSPYTYINMNADILIGLAVLALGHVAMGVLPYRRILHANRNPGQQQVVGVQHTDEERFTDALIKLQTATATSVANSQSVDKFLTRITMAPQ
jgi:hypothetical protein